MDSRPTRFCGETVQSELEAILASGHRQVAARIALYCSELVEAARELIYFVGDPGEAAREDERQQLRDRQLAAGAGGQTGDGTGATDRDCVWILRTAFSIRNKAVIQRGKDEALVDVSWGAADAAEAATYLTMPDNGASRAELDRYKGTGEGGWLILSPLLSKKQQPAVLDPNLVEPGAWT
ncbi:hypothetical protein AK812_SmicGene12035 [Symbiodinium microadriaticum]|uniref:Uncharacterized protein n=1 Tax=Symbiodinium microadriaticum TaxID=2951 RepID=A0A1Q9EBJ5_SYMMI|nr:hypothetical protein AK812_SmicGene12035 [Symbiodinium microadriaticum]